MKSEESQGDQMQARDLHVGGFDFSTATLLPCAHATLSIVVSPGHSDPSYGSHSTRTDHTHMAPR